MTGFELFAFGLLCFGAGVLATKTVIHAADWSAGWDMAELPMLFSAFMTVVLIVVAVTVATAWNGG